MPLFMISYKDKGQTKNFGIESPGLMIHCEEKIVACTHYATGLEGRHDFQVGKAFGLLPCNTTEDSEVEDERRDLWTPSEED